MKKIFCAIYVVRKKHHINAKYVIEMYAKMIFIKKKVYVRSVLFLYAKYVKQGFR